MNIISSLPPTNNASMDYDPPIPPPPLPPPTSVAARFVSQTSLDAAKAVREADWKAMHEKLGAEVIPEYKEKGEGEEYDGRSLWEKLQEHKDKKQEAFDEQIKFKNQFRALDEDEISFLDTLIDDDFEEEDRKRAVIKEELAGFRAAVISRSSLAPPPVVSAPLTLSPVNAVASTSSRSPVGIIGISIDRVAAAAPQAKTTKKKKSLPGVVVKKTDKGVAKRKMSDVAAIPAVEKTPVVPVAVSVAVPEVLSSTVKSGIVGLGAGSSEDEEVADVIGGKKRKLV